jgi:amidophosphoribosyltransferase
VHFSAVKELQPGHALIVKRNGDVSEERFAAPQKRAACSFERIYFSRGSDRNIYNERKALGFHLTERVLQAVNYDFKNTVFSFIPNTAETAYRGLQQGVEEALNKLKIQQIKDLNGNLTNDDIERILAQRPRFESIAVKDAKLRTFITEDASRSELVSHVYDVTYGVVQDEKDTLVLIDDSIVRGTTLRESILKITARLRPKKIIIVSSAPQIRYPDCYGIDMSKMGEFVAFQALIGLLKDFDKTYLLQTTYELCKTELKLYKESKNTVGESDKNGSYQIVNQVQKLYDLFTHEELALKIAEMIRPPDITPEVQVLYQTITGLHQSCPNNTGDWYFSGNYPTNGGHRVVNQAFINYMEGKNIRAY